MCSVLCFCVDGLLGVRVLHLWLCDSPPSGGFSAGPKFRLHQGLV